MKFRLLIVLFFLESCSPNYTKIDNRKPYNSTGFAYIFNESDYENKIIKKKLNNDQLNIQDNLNVAIIIPDKDIIPGAETLSPAYLVFDNYEKILNWNRSLRFALAVCTLKESFKNEI